MSRWREADNNDIEVDAASDQVNILAGWDEWGNVYLTLTFDQIKDINAQIEAIEARIEGKG